MSKRIIRLKSQILEEKIKTIGKCEKCGLTDAWMLTLDHIIPVEFLMSIGLSSDDCLEEKYLQLYCRRCNSFKGHKIDFANPRSKLLLLELINNLPDKNAP